MKNTKLFISTCLILFSLTLVTAQDENNKWALAFGINSVDINPTGLGDIGGVISDYVGLNDASTLPAISMVSVTRYLNDGFSVRLLGSLNRIDKELGVNNTLQNPLSFFALDAAALYDLNSLFGETGWWDPYISLGLGSVWIGDDVDFTIAPGWGFNSWINENLGIGFSSTFNTGQIFGFGFDEIGNAPGYFQHSLGLIIRFNGDE